MELVTIQPTLVHAASRTLTLPQVAAFRDTTIPDMLNDAESWGLVATGPWTFVSSQLPQDNETTFQLTICRPIASGGDYGGQFDIIELPAITAGVAHFEGPLTSIYEAAYVPLLDDLLSSETPLTGEVREMYHVMSAPDSPSNKVEILIGVATQDETAAGVIDVDGQVVPDQP